MIALARGDWSAQLLPERGAAFAALAWRGVPVLRPLPPGGDPNRAFDGAFVMAPWANRLDAGRLPTPDGLHVLPINRPEDGTAIHGLARDRRWDVRRLAAGAAVLEQRLRVPPFDLALRLIVRLDGALALGLRVRNLGRPMPLGLGWHPWFAAPADAQLRFAATARLQADARTLPIGAEPCDGVDATVGELAGLDGHFAGWDGAAGIVRPDLRLTLRAGGDWARNVHVFAPRGAGVLCVEPVSHVPDAPNRTSLARAHGAMPVVPTGGALRGWLRLACVPTGGNAT